MVAGGVRPVVVLYNHDYVGIGLDGLSIGFLRQVVVL